MAKRKFQTGDIVHLNSKAYLHLRTFAKEKGVQYFEVKGYTTRYSSGEYQIMAFDGEGKEVRWQHHPGTIGATASMLELGKRMTQVESLQKTIGKNLEMIENLKRQNSHLEYKISVIQELGVEAIDEKAYNAAKALAESGKFATLKEAYNMVLMVKEELV